MHSSKARKIMASILYYLVVAGLICLLYLMYQIHQERKMVFEENRSRAQQVESAFELRPRTVKDTIEEND